MTSLDSFLKNHLDMGSLSDERLGRYAKAHIALLKANDAGNTYLWHIRTTEKSYNDFMGAIKRAPGIEGKKEDVLGSIQKIAELRKLLEMDMVYNAIVITQENFGDIGETKRYFEETK